MNIGFTLDEKIFDRIPPNELLFKTNEMGASSIEVSPDKTVLPGNTYCEIAKLCDELNIETNYHVPYFAHDFLYEIMNFNEYRKDIKCKYESLVSIISDMQSIICKPSILTIHGAVYKDSANKEKALYNTLSFLDWYLNFLDKKNIQLELAIETLNKNEAAIGSSREDIVYISSEFKGSQLGVCLDICHDSFNYYPGKAPLDNAFYENIIYSHIHGIDIKKSISHIALKKSDIDFKEQIDFLLQNNYSRIINLELLVNFCGDSYLKDLFNDIDYIKNLINVRQ
jgi:sugar phosphate isomerase/epimerase